MRSQNKNTVGLIPLCDCKYRDFFWIIHYLKAKKLNLSIKISLY